MNDTLTTASYYHSMSSMRTAHAKLIKARRDDGLSPEFLGRVQAFVHQGIQMGALLDSQKERLAAQSMLDYWDNVLSKEGQVVEDPSLYEFDPTLAPEIDDALCPYIGLYAFQETEGAYFYGRQEMVNLMIGRLAQYPMLVVVGPSGSGKSSVVLAGLIPKLKEGGLQGFQDHYFYPPLVPGSNPLINLSRTLRPKKAELDEWLEAQVPAFKRDEHLLLKWLERYRPEGAVLVIDQFEEAFTLCLDESIRKAFVANLTNLITSSDSRYTLIMTMRSDFETYALMYPEFETLFRRARMTMVPLNAAELREAILKPADSVGLKFEEGVVEALIQDTLGEPAALPLLQFTLLRLWETRTRNRVTWESYRRLGGGRLALANSADEIYDSLIPEEQVTARRILLRMVRPTEGLEVTSKRILRISLYTKGEASDRVDRVLDKLIKARLVRLTDRETPEEAQVEVAHEALVRNWPRLVHWLETEREKLRRRLSLTEAASQWDAYGRLPEALWRGSLMEMATDYPDLNALEKQFIEASWEAADAEEREREASQQRELEQAKALAQEKERLATFEYERAEEQKKLNERLRWIPRLSAIQFIGFVLLVVILVVAFMSNTVFSNFMLIYMPCCLLQPLLMFAIVAIGVRATGVRGFGIPGLRRRKEATGS